MELVVAMLVFSLIATGGMSAVMVATRSVQSAAELGREGSQDLRWALVGAQLSMSGESVTLPGFTQITLGSGGCAGPAIGDCLGLSNGAMVRVISPKHFGDACASPARIDQDALGDCILPTPTKFDRLLMYSGDAGHTLIPIF